MATSRAIKNRIKATKNIQQITKAMQAVSAVKMRKSEHAAISSRPYALSALEILKNIRLALKDEEVENNHLVVERTVNRICLVVITSDKGLAGAFNTNVIRKAQNFIAHSKTPVDVVTIGKRGRDALRRRARLNDGVGQGFNVIKDFIEMGDSVSIEETLHIAHFLHEQFRDKKCDEVVVIYTNFLSALKQTVVARKVMPVTVHALEEIAKHIIPTHGMYSGIPQAIDRTPGVGHPVLNTRIDYKFEPSAEAVLEKLIPLLINIEIHQSILEANASEHSSRMVAMKSASENASELIGDLRIVYNKARQAQITKELTEITAGAESLSN
jgi:F-type H+-transporting ATPase subunit gamma